MQTVTTPAGKHGLDCTAELVYPDPRSCPQLHVAEPEAAPFAQAVAKAASQEMKLITTPLQLTKHAWVHVTELTSLLRPMAHKQQRRKLAMSKPAAHVSTPVSKPAGSQNSLFQAQVTRPPMQQEVPRPLMPRPVTSSDVHETVGFTWAPEVLWFFSSLTAIWKKATAICWKEATNVWSFITTVWSFSTIDSHLLGWQTTTDPVDPAHVQLAQELAWGHHRPRSLSHVGPNMGCSCSCSCNLAGETSSGSGDAGSGDIGSGSADTGSGSEDVRSGSGDSGSRAGDMGSGSGDMGSGSGEVGSGSGEVGSGSGDIGSGSGDIGSGSGEVGSGSGDAGSGSGDVGSGSHEAGSGAGYAGCTCPCSCDLASEVGSGSGETGSGSGDAGSGSGELSSGSGDIGSGSGELSFGSGDIGPGSRDIGSGSGDASSGSGELSSGSGDIGPQLS